MARRTLTTTRQPPALSLRVVLAIAAIALAYHYSLLALARSLALQTPLAYLALVPVIAGILIWFRVRSEPTLRPIHDRQLDYIIGFAFLAAALSILLLVPRVLGPEYWLKRIDLLSLPLFVAGTVSLLFGVRRLWSIRFAIAFLLLAWPVPYLPLTGPGLRWLTEASIVALSAASEILPFATPAAHGNGLFYVNHGDGFGLIVASECAGANSVVGFLLIGAAMMQVFAGGWPRRLAWFAVGIVAMWILNLVRIELIFATGFFLGHDAAVESLHPVAGLVVFNVGVLAMLAAAPRFGLRYRPLPIGLGTPADASPVRRLGLVAAIVASATLAAGVANAGFARYHPILGDVGDPKLSAFRVEADAAPLGWTQAREATYTDSTAFFGRSSAWDRLVFQPHPSAPVWASAPLYVDIIKTDDPDALAAYGVEACYGFHGFDEVSIRSIALADGAVNAKVASWTSPKGATDWSVLWWEWPYDRDGHTWYQRVALLIPNPGDTDIRGLPPAVDSEDRFAAAEALLEQFGATLVAGQLRSNT